MKRNFGDPNKRFQRKIFKTDTCWWWRGKPNEAGYGRFCIDYNIDYAHRWAWYFNTGEWPKLLVCHTCDNKLCVNPAHLFLGTDEDNNFDKWLKGNARGRERTLSHEQRDAVRRWLEKGVPQRKIAEAFKCSQATISEINRNAHEYAP